jgi:hypothetical protein
VNQAFALGDQFKFIFHREHDDRILSYPSFLRFVSLNLDFLCFFKSVQCSNPSAFLIFYEANH